MTIGRAVFRSILLNDYRSATGNIDSRPNLKPAKEIEEN